MNAPVVLLPLLLAAACARSDPAVETADAPDGWTVVAAPALGSDAASCANRAVGGTWAVTLDSDSARPLIRPFQEARRVDTVAVPGGRLTSEDFGEFGGGAVWWEPVAGGRTRVAETNLVIFIPTDAGVLGLTGLAHLRLNEGHLVRFVPQPDNGWAMERILDLGAAPNAYAVLPGDTLLVATSGTLMAARPPAAVHVLHRNEVWHYTYPNSVVRSRAGVVYLGMRSAVARLRPSGGGYVEEWLVPASCAKRRRVNDIGECECVVPNP